MFKDISDFTADRFTATYDISAEEKAQFGQAFIRLVESDFAKELFTEELYWQIAYTFGFGPNLDHHEFSERYFRTNGGKATFIREILNHCYRGLPYFCYADVELALREWLVETRFLEKFEERVLQASNSARAQRFENFLPQSPGDECSNCIEFLTDCLHWCAREGEDFEQLLSMARGYFKAQQQEKHQTSLEAEAPEAEETQRPARQHER